MIPLQAGDTIGAAAPSSPFARRAFDRGVGLLRDLGFRVTYGRTIFSRFRAPAYLAGDDRSRARDLMRLFRDEEVRAIICTRGGYGVMRLLPHLDLAAIRRHPKPVVGYSDITALLHYLLGRTSCPVLHGPMVSTLGAGLSEASVEGFRRALTSAVPAGRMSPRGLRVLRPGAARGRLTGGCLSLITASLGTPWETTTDGTILFLEDHSEAPYRVDRMLTHLAQAGKLRGVRGVLFGQMRGCGVRRDLEGAVVSALGGFRGPILMGFPSGHVTGRTFLTLPFGVPAELDSRGPFLSLLGSPFA